MQTKVAAKKFDYKKLFAPAALVILYLFFSLVGKNFLSVYTLKTILESAYFIGFMAFGVTFVIITGGIDLSIGTVMMCSALIGGVAFSSWGWPLPLALLLVPLVGVIFGFMNGLMVAKLKLPPFIATLGTMLVSQGFGSIISKVQTQRYPTIGSENEWFKNVFYRTGAFPTGIVYLLVAFVIGAFLLNKTRLGRYTFAIGSNEEAVRLSGVKTDRWKILVYTICGLFAGLAGIFYAATYTTVIPGTGNGQELNAIAGVVIGGTSMSGGSGTMVGTLIGVFIMATLKTGLASMGLQAHWQTFITGFVVIGAVLLDIWRNNASLRVKNDKKETEKATDGTRKAQG
ncbi:MAG: ABC transporter permease [Clostridia bacterium]